MKKTFLTYITLLGGLLFSCQDLNLEPKGILGEPELFGNEYGVKKYFAGIYNYLPIEDFLYYGTNSDNAYRPNNYWEAGKFSQGNMSGEFFNTWVGVDNDGFAYWPYDRIRDVNTFIENFPTYRDNYTDADFNKLMGEAHFLRAFFYFGLAKRYGGIPIIKEVQNPLAGAETLNVSRSTEYDTWKFIYEDLKYAVDNMTESSESGRANKYVAAALLSRTMLYAGSIAKYSQYLGFESEAATQAGLAGMDPAQANEFFQYCVDAGKVVEAGPYSLYTRGYPDKATNFANLFLDPASSESIFIKDYDMTSPGNNRLRHSYDALMSPQPDMSSFVGAESYPPLDFMELYEMPAYTNPDGTPIRFDSRGDIRNGMEPRMRGTMYFDGDELRGKTFSIQKGIYRSYNGLAADAQGGSNGAPINSGGNRILGGRGWTTEINGATYNITGAHGHFDDQGGENNGWGAAFVRKYINPDMATSDVREYRSDQHWVVFRLGEIYLNTAEALYELGNRDEAFDYIEKIRDRAGAQLVRPAIDVITTNRGTINNANYPYAVEKSLQFIRDERARELYGENHWWWDLRRWRTADQVLNQFRHRVLSCYYVADEGKYIYLDEDNRYNRSWTASKQCYYEPIPWGEIGKNGNLLPQNPLY
ncbi:Starch-binding associating with outer membrane [Parapedobacter luteus]|uniref:Starch-binding associating with outer membrane n=1 Tax=Parapedobacter luteus TaxID=623280 RepID=A0A1T4ZZW1_9SPHI|nr:RagB/SusD family nutrient uptake outer membrane protein [Parapedobacter luteus]SKB28057.1 Starch-binding associating with outer membrane [Parapedobacter luteus]